MPTINYVLKDGTRRAIDVPKGTSIMLGAINNNLRGIDAECGGCCSCATCHVYIEESDMARLKPADSVEKELLEGVAAERKPTSRLSCQIDVTAALDGITVHMPDRQS